MEDLLGQLNGMVGDLEAFEQLEEDLKTPGVIFYAPSFSRFAFVAEHSPIADDALIVYDGDNRLRVPRRLFVTQTRGDDLLFSLDGREWYSSEADVEANTQSAYPDYSLRTVRRGENITVHIEWAYRLHPSRVPAQVDVSAKPVIHPAAGMIFVHNEDQLVTHDLENYVLELPAGTTITGDFAVGGNIVAALTRGDTFLMQFMRDVYVYRRGPLVSLSFDGSFWGNTIFSLEFRPEAQFRALDADSLALTTALLLRQK
jgi:hypothetical protein